MSPTYENHEIRLLQQQIRVYSMLVRTASSKVQKAMFSNYLQSTLHKLQNLLKLKGHVYTT